MNQLAKTEEKKFIQNLDHKDLVQLIAGAVYDFFRFRNITIKDDQAEFLIQEIIKWSVKKTHIQTFLYSWSFRKFNDNNILNLSASFLISLLEKGYRSEEYKALLPIKEEVKQIEMPEVNYQEVLQSFIDEYKKKGYTSSIITLYFYDWVYPKFDSEISKEEIYNIAKQIVLDRFEKEILGVRAYDLKDIQAQIESIKKSSFSNMHSLVLAQCKRWRLERYISRLINQSIK